MQTGFIVISQSVRAMSSSAERLTMAPTWTEAMVDFLKVFVNFFGASLKNIFPRDLFLFVGKAIFIYVLSVAVAGLLWGA